MSIELLDCLIIGKPSTRGPSRSYERSTDTVHTTLALSNVNRDQSKLLHPGNHKLLQLEFKQQNESSSADSTAEMDTTDSTNTQDKADFQRVGEFAQMG